MSKGETAEAADIQWDKKPRKMLSESDKELTIALPAAFALVIKKIEDYDMEKNNVTMKLTIILRVKCTGLLGGDSEAGPKLRQHLQTGLKIRLNESELSLLDDLNVKPRDAKSMDWDKDVDPASGDMFSYTIRHDTLGETNYDNMASFPFDTTHASLKLEISHFETKLQDGSKVVYRFDCYQAVDWLSWKTNINGMPDFGIDYERTAAVNIAEEKKISKDGLKVSTVYYPGIEVAIPLPRSALQPSLNYFVPAFIVSAFVLAANNVAEFDSVMEVTGIALLTYVQLY